MERNNVSISILRCLSIFDSILNHSYLFECYSFFLSMCIHHLSIFMLFYPPPIPFIIFLSFFQSKITPILLNFTASMQYSSFIHVYLILSFRQFKTLLIFFNLYFTTQVNHFLSLLESK